MQQLMWSAMDIHFSRNVYYFDIKIFSTLKCMSLVSDFIILLCGHISMFSLIACDTQRVFLIQSWHYFHLGTALYVMWVLYHLLSWWGVKSECNTASSNVDTGHSSLCAVCDGLLINSPLQLYIIMEERVCQWCSFNTVQTITTS